jgi:hypothetical protein
MKDSVRPAVAADPLEVWGLVSDVTNTGRLATGPAVGARFRGRVNRNGWGLRYATTCCAAGRTAAT